jgi:hypothetical protein
VQIFEHLLRKRHEIFPISKGEPYQYNQPTSIAHIGMLIDKIYQLILTAPLIDTTIGWTEAMVRRLNPQTSNELLKGRVLCVK